MAKKSGHILKSTHLVITPTDENDLWNADWTISLRGEEEPVGRVTFFGGKGLGIVPIYIELEERYRDRGYGCEAIRTMVDWAFLHKDVYEITAETEHTNDKCIGALEKAGFVFRTGDRQRETYSIQKEKPVWTGLYVFIGVVNGLILGVVFNNSWLGLAIGMLIALVLGLTLDGREKKERENVTGKKDE